MYQRVIAFSDHDGDGKPDFIGVDDSSIGAVTMQWAGSDGTVDPRSVNVYLPAGAMFSGQLVR